MNVASIKKGVSIWKVSFMLLAKVQLSYMSEGPKPWAYVLRLCIERDVYNTVELPLRASATSFADQAHTSLTVAAQPCFCRPLSSSAQSPTAARGASTTGGLHAHQNSSSFTKAGHAEAGNECPQCPSQTQGDTSMMHATWTCMGNMHCQA